MARQVVVDPVTRIEGHLKVETVVEDGVVKEARCSGMLFRGIELILKGRDPRDAQIITQRICGVCPQSHGIAAARALDHAFGIKDQIPPNGQLVRCLIQGIHQISDHILHFYHLAALDYVDVARATAGLDSEALACNPDLASLQSFLARGELGPFVPRYEGDYRLSEVVNREVCLHYLKALEMRRRGHEMVAILGGKIPHSVGVVPGGAVFLPTLDKIAALLWRFREVHNFVDQVYLPDVLQVAEEYSDYFSIGSGCRKLLSYGAYEAPQGQLFREGLVNGAPSRDQTSWRDDFDPGRITEEVTSSWYQVIEPGSQEPHQGATVPLPDREGAYSWIKSPRYAGEVREVGPLAHILANYASGDAATVKLVDWALAALKAPVGALYSVMGRHLARALATKLIADQVEGWLLALDPGSPVYQEYQIPEEGWGMGLTEAARGALGHWIRIQGGKIANYQCVVPTTWNASPRDGLGQPGPMEQALIGAPVEDPDNPWEVVRIIRSFDPCIACAVHLLTPKGTERARCRIL